MYIPPFVCGILATVFVEVIALIIYGICISGKDKQYMKQPKKLKLEYKLAVCAYNLNPKHWMLLKDGDVYITIINKQTGKIKVIDKYARPKKGDKR